jgi:hypothetical protein
VIPRTFRKYCNKQGKLKRPNPNPTALSARE